MEAKHTLAGRERELKFLTRMVQSGKPEFIAMYGRRRVGKTFLIRHFFNNRFTFYATGLANAKTAAQLSNFTSFFNESFNTSHTPFNNWMEAFRQLIAALKKRKGLKIVFLDELPWFDTKKSDFITGLEFFWNAWGSTQSGLKLIVCGSAASWIINKLIQNKGGLHNRLTGRLKLEPFTLQETEAFLQLKNIRPDRYQVVQLYMAMGGIPYYLEYVQPGLSAVQNIQQICFDPEGILNTEFVPLFASLFAGGRKHELLLRRIYQLGASATREELMAAGGVSTGGDVSVKLKELEESGFISSYVPYGKNSSKKIYAITDFYTLFYLKFIEPSPGKKKVDWQNKINDPAISAWSGFAFEQVCFQHTEQIKNALRIGGISSTVTAWRQKGTAHQNGGQIDMLIDRSDRTINLCEIKFSVGTFTITRAYDRALRDKLQVFKEVTKTRKSIFLTFITTFGLKKNEYSHSLVQNEITLDDLFSAV